MNLLFKDIWNFLTNRLFITFCIVTVAFYFLVVQLFELQIVKGEDYLHSLNNTTTKRIAIEATRGTIYDRYGRPIAVNETAFSIKIDPSIRADDLTSVIQKLVTLLKKNEEEIIDDFPISKEEPYTFLFNGHLTREENWKRDMDINKDLDATKTFAALRDKFGVPEELSNEEARDILNLRSAVYMERWRYQAVPVSLDVKPETVAAIEEENEDFQSVYVEIDSLRHYPEGKYLSHILGYIRKISNSEYTENKDAGYTENSIIGKDGIERAFESYLKGTDGEMMVEVQNIGRRVSSSVLKEPIPGDKVYLTIDSELTRFAFDTLEDMLSEILINKINGVSESKTPATVKEILFSLINGNNVSLKKIYLSEEGSVSAKIRDFLLERLPDNNFSDPDDIIELKQVLVDALDSNEISSNDIFLIMHEQELITGDEDFVRRIRNATTYTLRQILVEKIEERELTPQIINIDPSTGSVVVVDINDGSVLASVSYPSYDNNEFVNNFNNEYWYKVNSEDLTTPMINRAFWEPRSPGSTFKMLSALTGLKAGVISPSTQIYDEGSFTKVGIPYANCWIYGGRGSHGPVNVVTALEVSCNYFFFEMAYRMGNSKDGNHLDSINLLNEYMIDFGFGSPTGVEISEIYNSYKDKEVLRISSPEYFNYITNSEFGSTTNWPEGDTIRTAIGQSFNSYTAAVMAKYIATLANGGTRYEMHMLDKIESYSGELLEQKTAVVEKELDIPEEHLKTVYDGMLAVTEGRQGTAASVFSGSEIRVAGKTGTAQQDTRRSDHSSFGGFAPYDDPQIAVYVVLPFGDTKAPSAPASRIARKVIEKYLDINEESVNNTLNNSLSR